MSALTGRTIADSYKELLKTTSSTGVSGSLISIEDGNGTGSALSISTAGIYSSGTLEVLGLSTLNSLAVSGATSLAGASTLANAAIATGSIENAVVIRKSPVITLAGDLSGNVTLSELGSATLTATIVANATQLGTDTTGAYVATIAGTANEISVSGSGAETANVTLSLPSTLSFASKTITDLGSVTTAQINGGTINGTSIGATTPSTGDFSRVTLSNQGELRLSEATAGGSDYVALRSPTALASSYTLSLPTTGGSAGFALITDGTGNLSWQNPYGGGATSTISAGDSSLAVVDAGSGTITGSIDGSPKFLLNSTGLSITGDLSVSGTFAGTATNANTLTTGRNFSITGDVTAPAISFNGSGNVALSSTLGTGVVNNTNIGASAAIAFSKLASLTSGNILVGNASNVPTSISLSGDATLSNTGALTIANGAIDDNKISATAGIDFAKLEPLTSSHILVGNASNVATGVSVSGDATISNTGAVTIANNAITNAKVSSSAAIDFSKLGALTTGQIVAGNAGVATATTLGGDATIGATGTLTIANDAITTAKILNSNVTSAKVDTTSVAVLGTAQQYTRTHNFSATTLTDAASIAWDASQNQVASVTLTASRTLANPTNMVNGAVYILIVKQNATGGWTLSYGANYKWPSAATPTIAPGANATSILTFVSDGTNMYGVSSLNYT